MVTERVEVRKRGEPWSEKEESMGNLQAIKAEESQDLWYEKFNLVQNIQVNFTEPQTVGYKHIDKSLPHVPHMAFPYYLISVPEPITSHPYDIFRSRVDSEIMRIGTTIAELYYNALRNVPSIDFREPKKLTGIKPEVDLAQPSRRGSLDDVVRFIHVISMITFRRVPEIRASSALDSSFSGRKIAIIEQIKGIVEPEDAPTILEWIFDIDEGVRSRLAYVLYDRPCLIIACKPPIPELNYIELLKRLLREVYRICAGGLPRPRHISRDLSAVEFDISADRSVYVITDEKNKEPVSKLFDEHVLDDRLRELFSQRYGFLVLYGLEDGFSVKIGEDAYPPPIKLRVADRPKEQFERAIKALYGFVEEPPILKPVDLDAYTVLLEETFYDKIRKLLSDTWSVLTVEPSTEDEEGIGGESTLHFALKVFCVKYFMEKKGVETVETEVEIPTAGKIDVLVKGYQSPSLAVEVETLYGTGLPLIKLKRTIESRLKAGLNLWVVVPPMQAFLYLKELMLLRKLYRKAYGERLEFYTTNLHSSILITLSEFLEKVKQQQ
jgi:hypothetical protein